MAGVSLSLYGLLALAEIGILLLVVTGIAVFKWRTAHREAVALLQALSEAKRRIKTEVVEQATDPGPQLGYAEFLREQLDHSSLLLGEAPEQGADNEHTSAENCDQTRRMLAVRHQFLQLEFDHQTQGAGDDPETRRRSLVTGMQALLEGLGRGSTGGDAGDASAEQRADADGTFPQVERLRTVIDGQQAVMRELRHLLEEHGGDSDDLRAALRKLNDAETQVEELQRCVQSMVREQAGHGRVEAARPVPREQASPDAEMLRDLVGDQQRTITKLQTMLQTLLPESGRAQELADAIEKIQRSNSELSSCVMVLEDENNMLRDKVETLQGRIADLEAFAGRGKTETDSLLSDLFGGSERPADGTQ